MQLWSHYLKTKEISRWRDIWTHHTCIHPGHKCGFEWFSSKNALDVGATLRPKRCFQRDCSTFLNLCLLTNNISPHCCLMYVYDHLEVQDNNVISCFRMLEGVFARRGSWDQLIYTITSSLKIRCEYVYVVKSDYARIFNLIAHRTKWTERNVSRDIGTTHIIVHRSRTYIPSTSCVM